MEEEAMKSASEIRAPSRLLLLARPTRTRRRMCSREDASDQQHSLCL